MREFNIKVLYAPTLLWYENGKLLDKRETSSFSSAIEPAHQVVSLEDFSFVRAALDKSDEENNKLRRWKEWYDQGEKNHRDTAKRAVEALGYKPGDYQAEYRKAEPVDNYNPNHAATAIIDALVFQGGIMAWYGDGVGCVEQMLTTAYAEIARLRKQNKDLKALVDKYTNDEELPIAHVQPVPTRSKD